MVGAATARTEYGDFQTPGVLASLVVGVLRLRGVRPACVVEPTCGRGAFVYAALHGFEGLSRVLAVEINPSHFLEAQSVLRHKPLHTEIDLRQQDFFGFDWLDALRDLPEPLLLLGNPPWVTSAGLGAIASRNLPAKSNFQNHKGLDAITGKGNFDIAEWMILKLLSDASGRRATLAMLVKTSVARRVLGHAWRTGMPITGAAQYRIDAGTHFGVSADACLLVCDLDDAPGPKNCDLYDIDAPEQKIGAIGMRDGVLLANADAYDRWGHLAAAGRPSPYQWRSGVKHDCSAVMELAGEDPSALVNGLGEAVDLEPDCVFPLLKGSGVASGTQRGIGTRWMLVPQRTTDDDTAALRERVPKTWEYLNRHAERLDRRGSSIYRKRPRFAVFGIGPYTFAPWKVAICALYKKLAFTAVGPHAGRPVVFDDTVCHLSFETEAQAQLMAGVLNGPIAREFFGAFLFWDAKRPITVDILRRLDLVQLARACGREHDLLRALRPSEAIRGLFGDARAG